MKNIIALMAGLMFSGSVWAYGTGVSSFPLQLEKKVISTEFTGITSTGGGIGLQGRFSMKINPKTTLDGGLGIGGGQRTGRIFAGADYELFPDYERQPKISIKGTLESAKEFEVRRTILGFAPTVSKGFNLWGSEAYPFVSLPFGISLDGKDKNYETNMNLNAGISGHLPFEDYKNLIGTLEASLDIKDSYTGIFLGVSYPMN
jgi:hypothetical protein